VKRRIPALLILNFLVLLFHSANAQKENNIWYFGKTAGLDFNGGAPVPLTNGVMNTWEGTASVADASTGTLLFYTNGEFVWNRNHILMPNGSGLWGQYSSTQSSLIVPVPGSSTLYYLFTTDAGTGGFPNGGVMGYSVIDMTLAAGMGDVTLKNIALFDTTSEQLTATLSSDGCKVWVLAHKWNSDEFYAYLVSDTGISAPVISAAGSVHSCAFFGQMKVSPDGTKIALPLPCDSAGNMFVELLDFDNTTGIASNGILLPQDHFVYGLEFSPGSKYLYTVDHNNSGTIIYKQVAQYDVTPGNAAAIIASRIIVGIVWNATTLFNGAAQLAPDGKIYVAPTDKDSLCVINDPDSGGLACNFVVPGFYLVRQNDHGLPNKVVKANSPCTPAALFNAPNHICPGTCTDFINLSQGATSYQWIFNGASPATSTDVNPSGICYAVPGNYSVTLIATNAGGSDSLTLSNYITVYPNPAPQGITQSGDTLFAIAGAVSYQWYFNGDTIPGATGYFCLATQSGNYNVVATDINHCEVEAAIFDVAAAVQQADGIRQWTVFPGPVSDRLKIMVNDNGSRHAIHALSIYNSVGETVLALHCNAEGCGMPVDLDVHTLPPGIYFLRIAAGNNETHAFKFTVMR
jgi:hypothetical protein